MTALGDYMTAQCLPVSETPMCVRTSASWTRVYWWSSGHQAECLIRSTGEHSVLESFILYFRLTVTNCLFVFLFIQNTSHCSLLTHTNYTKHIIHTGPTHETHKTHERFFSENIRNIYTQQEKFSPNT